MLNMIKMDLYRMVRTKSMYVVWIVMAAAIFFSTSMSKLDIDTMNKEAEQQQTESIETRNHQYGNVRIPADTAGRKSNGL